MIRVQKISFLNLRVVDSRCEFDFSIDDENITISLTHNVAAALDAHSQETVFFNLGMCYLIDLVELLVPAEIFINFNLDPLQLHFWKTFYQEVAKEKFYLEKLDLTLLESDWSCNQAGKSFGLVNLPAQREKIALCLTGGKESLTLLKLLKDKKKLQLFFLNPETSVHRTKVFERVKDEFETIKTISNRPQIFRALKQKHQTNLGSGVDMAHLVFNALLFAPEYVLIGNEYSANFPNLLYQGYMINHQYIKTIHVAQKINEYIHNFVASDYSYYSPFFNLYELKIAEALFKDPEYLEVWTSCNLNNAAVNFCSNCAKCAFTYLVSLVHVSEDKLRQYFSRDMLTDLELYKPMMDFTGVKPLDCVGEKNEVWVALDILSQKAEQADKPVVRYFSEKIKPYIKDELPGFAREMNSLQKVPTTLPPDLQKIINDAFGFSKSDR